MSEPLTFLMFKNAFDIAKNANTIIIEARIKNTGENLRPEILIHPAASGKHIARVFETPYAKNGAVKIPANVSAKPFICSVRILSFI